MNKKLRNIVFKYFFEIVGVGIEIYSFYIVEFVFINFNFLLDRSFNILGVGMRIGFYFFV